MKRTDITALFPDATDEQIDKIMNLNGADINKAKGDLDSIKEQLTAAQAKLADHPKDDALQAAKDRASALQAELDSLKRTEELRTMREKVSTDMKIPAHLLTGETEEACAEQAKAILAFAQNSGYPIVHDGGELHTDHKAVDKVSAGYAKLAESLFGEN